MTLGECIHGLEIPLCDICFPRRAPEPARAPTRPTRPRPATRTTSTGTGSTRGSSTRDASPRVAFDTFRVQHVTPIENLGAILADGAIRADATPAVDLSSDTTRELRRTTELPGGGTAAARVPFYLGSDANRWLQLRAGALGPTWSDAARAVRPAELVALVAALGPLGDVVLADGDAAATSTRFAAVGEDRARAVAMLGRMSADPGRLDEGEALGPGSVPLDLVSLVVVANEPIRDRVREAIADAGLRLRVAVNPPWFAVP